LALYTREEAQYSAKALDILADLAMVLNTFAVLALLVGTLAGSAADAL